MAEVVIRTNKYGDAVINLDDGSKVDNAIIKSWKRVAGQLVAEVVFLRCGLDVKASGDNIRRASV